MYRSKGSTIYVKGVGDGVTREARASPLLSLLHMEIRL